MRTTPLALAGAMLIEPAVYRDARGAFYEAWNERVFATGGIEAHFVQENVSVSSRHVLRGLHYQVPQAQGKLIRVLAGTGDQHLHGKVSACASSRPDRSLSERIGEIPAGSGH